MKIFVVTYAPFAEPDSLVDETIAAVNKKGAIKQIIPKGIPVSVSESSGRSAVKVTQDYKKQFLRAVLFQTQAGLSAGRALEEIIKESTGSVRHQLNPALFILMAGGSFSDALDALDMYDKATLAIMRAGERIGAMHQALQSAIDHYEKAEVSKKLLFGVLFGLSIDIFFAIASVLGVQFQFLPMVAQQGIKGATPEVVAAFHRNLSLAFWVNGFLTFITIAGILIVGWIFFAYKQRGSEALRYKVDAWLASTPYIKELFSHSAIAITFSMCATLLRGGISLHQAIEIIKGTAKSPLVEKFWETAAIKLESGESVAVALKSPVLTSSEMLIIAAHKDSKQLAAAFANISTHRDELAIRANKKFGMMAFIGAMIYSSVTVLVALSASYLQYQSMMSGMMDAGG
jgi:type II secretory pathway component PulF